MQQIEYRMKNGVAIPDWEKTAIPGSNAARDAFDKLRGDMADINSSLDEAIASATRTSDKLDQLNKGWHDLATSTLWIFVVGIIVIATLLSNIMCGFCFL